jgi:hypothetical protein
VNKPSSIRVELDTRDRLLDLKLAIWETQLVELYPNVCVFAEFDNLHQTARLSIQFENEGDQLHWQLTWRDAAQKAVAGWLTLSQNQLCCLYEKAT